MISGFRHRPRDGGFSLVELVVAISITAILAAVAIPRFVGKQGFDSRGFHDEAIGAVRFAQKTAIAWRRQVFVCVTASPSSVSVGTASGCGTPISHPATGNPLATTAPTSVTLSAIEFRFDGAGRPLDGASGNPSATTITIPFSSSIAGDAPRQIVVEAETGYVHP